MSKRTATRWYIGAWIVAASCVAVLVLTGRSAASRPSTLVELVIVLCGIVMFATWIAALVQLAGWRAWGWFSSMVLIYVLSLGTLGIVPMLAYAIAGPGGEVGFVAVRPSTT